MRATTSIVVAACAVACLLPAPARADGAAERARRLQGTWSVRNETADQNYSGSKATGQITFSGDHMTINSGGLAAAGLVAGSEQAFCLLPQDPISFKIIGNGSKQVLYLSWTGLGRKKPYALLPQDATITFIKFNRNEATLIGLGGCGSVGGQRISHLTRVR